ncbi:hypothetical protein [uncultured Tistrella sp.]|mgnify:CR=1 FL=1|uniref:hypothetical protein n=1 Tax=Tistrella mobilis TaxID=171437 RepID=UPI000C095253|nr:hypothetical protein [uncultured Tistrella sp.]MAM72343.1 hypothetical protein [Tistrella sp.]
MNALAAFHLRAAAIYVALGMAAGIAMAASQHFEYGPAHGHLNLLGFASSAIYGLVLKDRPDLAATRFAVAHAILAHLGLVVMTIGLTILFSGDVATGEPLAKAGSVLVLLGGLAFIRLIFAATQRSI